MALTEINLRDLARVMLTRIKAGARGRWHRSGQATEQAAMPFERVEAKSRPMIYLTTQCSTRPSTIAAEVKRSLATLEAFVVERAIGAYGPPLAIYSDWTGRLVTIEVGMPVSAEEATEAEGRILAGHTPEGPAAKITHRGTYTGLAEAYESIQSELQAGGARLSGVSWEVYLNDPRHVPPDELVTEIYVQLLDPPAATSG